MDGPGKNYLSEINQSEKDKYHMISLMWNIINKINLQTNKIEAESWIHAID